MSRNRAIVIGASMGGLFTARVLADHFESVMIVERDVLGTVPGHRRGVPQARHGHTLLPRGALSIDRWFPGLFDDLRAGGMNTITDDLSMLHFAAGGHTLATRGCSRRPVTIPIPSRPELEHAVRTQLLRDHRSVTVIDGHTARGCTLTHGATDTAELAVVNSAAVGTVMAADLVVDARGRGSGMPAWLTHLGYDKPPEMSSSTNITYRTQWLRPSSELHEQLILVGAQGDRPYGLGVFCHSVGAWEFIVFGVAGFIPPADLTGMLDLAAVVLPPPISAALRASHPIDSVHTYKYPASKWRRFDVLERLPAGLLAIGDAVCSFNPTYGQGMTAAALQAEALDLCLRQNGDDTELPHRFYRTAANDIRRAWDFDATAEHTFIRTPGEISKLSTRLLAIGARKYLDAASHEPELAERFLRVFGMIDPPRALFAPRGLWRRKQHEETQRLSSKEMVVPAPPIEGVRRYRVIARGVDFHVTEAGAGAPVLALHGWPQHHYAFRDLLSNPPAGLRIIAPDLPGFGWSGPAPHRWRKEEIVDDILALLDALGVDRVLVIGHDWGGWISFLLSLRSPERVRGLLALNIAHPWQTARTVLPHLWRFVMYQPLVAVCGMRLQQNTDFLAQYIFADRHTDNGSQISGTVPRGLTPEIIEIYASTFRTERVARAATDAYRTFWLRELPHAALAPEHRMSSIPTLAVFGTADKAIHPSLASANTARCEDYTVEYIEGCGHFILDERPDLVRQYLVRLDSRTTN